jgi:hypothetical protein
LGNITNIDGYLSIDENPALVDLQELSALQSIGGNLSISENNLLQDLAGLNELTAIPGDLGIYFNQNLISLAGLENITMIGGDLNINYNPSLVNLDELSNVSAIDGIVHIWINDDLEDLSGLTNVTTISGNISMYGNQVLSSLEGLGNVAANTIENLYIHDNPVLSECDIQSICEYLAAPNGTIEINNNAPGCNSPEEVEEACLTSTDEHAAIVNDIQIFPNPAKKTITIVSPSEAKIKEINIYNQTGLVILQKKSPVNKIDVSALQPGLYFVELATHDGNVRKKLIIE